MKLMDSWQMGTRRTNSTAIRNSLKMQYQKPGSKSLGVLRDLMMASCSSSIRNIQNRRLTQFPQCTLLYTLLLTTLWCARDSMRMALPVGTRSCLIKLNSSASSNSDSRFNPNHVPNAEASGLHRIHQGNTLQTSATLEISATTLNFTNAVNFKLESASSAINASSLIWTFRRITTLPCQTMSISKTLLLPILTIRYIHGNSSYRGP